MADGVFIDGRPSAGSSRQPLQVVNPADGTIVETFDLAEAVDVERAVAAASAAFPAWASAPPAERSVGVRKGHVRVLIRRVRQR